MNRTGICLRCNKPIDTMHVAMVTREGNYHFGRWDEKKERWRCPKRGRPG